MNARGAWNRRAVGSDESPVTSHPSPVTQSRGSALQLDLKPLVRHYALGLGTGLVEELLRPFAEAV